MNDADHTAGLLQHQELVLRARRKAIALWAILLVACTSLAAAAAICGPALASRGQLWVLGLFVIAGGCFIFVVSAVDKSSRALWPTGIDHFADVIKSTAPRHGA